MNTLEALKICKNVDSDKYSREEKLNGIRELWGYVARNQLTKPYMMKIISFLLEELWEEKKPQESKIPNRKFFPVLPKRCQDILKWRYGEMDGKRKTLEEVGKIYGLTRERIRQLEERSLYQLSWFAKHQNDENIKKQLIGYYGIKLDDEQTMITCCKCHGAGKYGVPIIDENGEWKHKYRIRECELCHGTGKITLDFYEDLQRCVRER